MSARRQIVPPDFTPVMGAYSHGLSVALTPATRMIFVTGQIAMDAAGAAVAPGDAAAQAEFVFENIKAILAADGATLDDVVKVQIFLTDMNDFAKVSPVRNRYLERAKPVSTLVEVSRLVKDGCCVEIEVIAMVEK
ncbi:MAG: RidA family protein [Rhodospirillales bacterium]|nr:RidA family protein [Alphaproteobacteria bacterium]MCB9986448.1 RidA family protein [Rhodospirillales bacterium]USO07006.1 MAG: RidA family protein [Rhodospirillales bacterium]